MSASVLVLGADQHQGLAVVRGLGLAGVPVVAAGASRRNIGFASRFSAATAVYTPPSADPDRFVNDVLRAAEQYRVAMIVPAIESALVALDGQRARVDAVCPLAAPPSEVLDWAIDKSKTIALAQQVGVPVPRTLALDDAAVALAAAREFRFPVALKPRGNALHAATRHGHDFKVRYARSWTELQRICEAFEGTGTLPLIQEYADGVGVCVSVLFDRDHPVALMPYLREREVPLTGGISVVRRTIALDERLQEYSVRMLQAIGWRGMAMVEFKYDRAKDQYVLMEINGRFQASTALSLDAGINFPELTYRLYAGLPLPSAPPAYRIGMRERWLRGDLHALLWHLAGTTAAEAVPQARAALPSRARALWNFLADFRPGMRFDEFKWYDPRPGLWEALACGRLLTREMLRGVRWLLRRSLRACRWPRWQAHPPDREA